VQRAFREALRGVSVLPTAVLRTLTEPVRPTPDSEDEPRARRQQSLAPHEIAWLRDLANGATVAQLAKQAGYSERAMFRLLRQVYARLQVRNRTQALLHARQQGWL
jgi:DNA-binding NarL/FixJ family response regulator